MKTINTYKNILFTLQELMTKNYKCSKCDFKQHPIVRNGDDPVRFQLHFKCGKCNDVYTIMSIWLDIENGTAHLFDYNHIEKGKNEVKNKSNL